MGKDRHRTLGAATANRARVSSLESVRIFNDLMYLRVHTDPLNRLTSTSQAPWPCPVFSPPRLCSTSSTRKGRTPPTTPTRRPTTGATGSKPGRSRAVHH